MILPYLRGLQVPMLCIGHGAPHAVLYLSLCPFISSFYILPHYYGCTLESLLLRHLF